VGRTMLRAREAAGRSSAEIVKTQILTWVCQMCSGGGIEYLTREKNHRRTRYNKPHLIRKAMGKRPLTLLQNRWRKFQEWKHGRTGTGTRWPFLRGSHRKEKQQVFRLSVKVRAHRRERYPEEVASLRDKGAC